MNLRKYKLSTEQIILMACVNVTGKKYELFYNESEIRQM